MQLMILHDQIFCLVSISHSHPLVLLSSVYLPYVESDSMKAVD